MKNKNYSKNYYNYFSNYFQQQSIKIREHLANLANGNSTDKILTKIYNI